MPRQKFLGSHSLLLVETGTAFRSVHEGFFPRIRQMAPDPNGNFLQLDILDKAET